MKNNFRLFVLVLSFCLNSGRISAEEKLSFPEPQKPISMDFQDADLKDILKIFSIQSGLNFIASDAVQDKKVTLYLDKVPIKDTINKLFKANNLSYELDEEANIILVKGSYAPAIETITKVFYLKYATVSSSPLNSEITNNMGSTSGSPSSTSSSTSPSTSSASGASSGSASGSSTSGTRVDIASAVKNILTVNGKVTENTRTNSIIVTDIPPNFSQIEELISRLDVPVPSVLIEVEMLDVSKNVVDKLGFQFQFGTNGNSPFTLLLPNSHFNETAKFFFGKTALRGADIVSSTTQGGVSYGNIFADVLDFLRTQSDTKFLARPRLLTLNNETAEIKIATQESIGVSTTTEATTGSINASPERAETGVSLRVTPQVNLDAGEITMFIYPQVSEATGGNNITSNNNTFTFRDPEVRSTKSVVRIKDGETVIVGGLIRNEFTQTLRKIPFFSDIPLLGALFTHKGGDSDKNKQRELIVFITPRIIKDTYNTALLQKKGVIPPREQDKPLAFERKQAIALSLNNFDKVK